MYWTTTSGIYIIEINTNTALANHIWVLDTGCDCHLVSSMHELKSTRKVNKGHVDLRVANGARVVALAVGSCQLKLPSGLVLNLNNCYYVPSLSKNIISISCLVEQGFEIFINKSKGCSIYLNDMLYCLGKIVNRIYNLDNKKEIHNVNTKRLKTNNLKPSYLWHCRLGHINETRMSKLHKEGSLGSFDYESYETCESCLLGKMTKSPFLKRVSVLVGC